MIDFSAVGWTVWNSSKTEWSEGCPAILTSVISDQFGGQVCVFPPDFVAKWLASSSTVTWVEGSSPLTGKTFCQPKNQDPGLDP